MKITIESTPTITEVGGTKVRLWTGVTESGIPCKVFVRLLAVRNDQDASQFAAELDETARPPELDRLPAIPLRNIL